MKRKRSISILLVLAFVVVAGVFFWLGSAERTNDDNSFDDRIKIGPTIPIVTVVLTSEPILP